MSNQAATHQTAEEIHMEHVQRVGLPSLQRLCELKNECEAKVLTARSVGGSAPQALDLLSVLNELLMIRTDPRLMQAFSRICAADQKAGQ